MEPTMNMDQDRDSTELGTGLKSVIETNVHRVLRSPNVYSAAFKN